MSWPGDTSGSATSPVAPRGSCDSQPLSHCEGFLQFLCQHVLMTLTAPQILNLGRCWCGTCILLGLPCTIATCHRPLLPIPRNPASSRELASSADAASP